ncbi:MAG: glutamate 5-kinase [Egibacteraceae bacterium]
MTDPRFDRPARAVVKVGSSSLRGDHGGLDRDLVEDLVAQLAEVQRGGTQVVLVSSGAVAAGIGPLGLGRRPADLPGLQAAASVGQGVLMHTYQACFAGHGLACGQVLLTPDDVVDRARYLNARHTFDRLLGLGAVPVVNENDTVATDELRFGDNDRLAALVASMLGAALLVLLSDVDGLLASTGVGSPGAPLDRVDDPAGLELVVDATPGSDIGRGGITSKLEAARIARFSAAHTVIANARRPRVVPDVVAGRAAGTWFPPSPRRPSRRKLWIAFAKIPRGRVVVDHGAVVALTQHGTSLLAAGVVATEGRFSAGDAVEVVDPDGGVVARGLVAYDAADLDRLRGRSTADLADEHGPGYARAAIHRDSLVVLT